MRRGGSTLAPSTPTREGGSSAATTPGGSATLTSPSSARKKEYRLRDQTLELDKVKKENFNLRMIISSLKDSIRNSGKGGTELADLRIEVNKIKEHCSQFKITFFPIWFPEHRIEGKERRADG